MCVVNQSVISSGDWNMSWEQQVTAFSNLQADITKYGST